MSAPPTSRCRILVVDGDERARDGAARALTEAGHAVDTAATRADVVSLLGERAYDLVLSDLKMPALDGPVSTSC
jgi:DNA-binding response OmpR family regulator